MGASSHPALIQKRDVRTLLLGFLVLLILFHSFRSSQKCIQSGFGNHQILWEVQATMTSSTSTSTRTANIIITSNNDHANRTLPPASTACDKNVSICTAPHCIGRTQFNSAKQTVAMCMIVKEEEPYLDEFVDYHHALGFDAFYIYDNSDDFVLRQWGAEKGCHANVVPYPGIAMQWTANHHCATMALHDNHTWVAFFDADEILILKQHDNIHDFLVDHCSHGALGINWLVFGTADRLAYSPQPFTKRFQYRKRKPEHLVKTIARLEDLDFGPGKFRIHYPFLQPGFSQHDTNGRNFTGHANAAAPVDVAVLHHYKYKSHQEFINKSVRGRATYDREQGKVEQQIALAKRGQVPAARWFDDTAWQKMKEYVPRYAAYDTIFPD